jgi:hypothetical protein
MNKKQALEVLRGIQKGMKKAKIISIHIYQDRITIEELL